MVSQRAGQLALELLAEEHLVVEPGQRIAQRLILESAHLEAQRLHLVGQDQLPLARDGPLVDELLEEPRILPALLHLPDRTGERALSLLGRGRLQQHAVHAGAIDGLRARPRPRRRPSHTRMRAASGRSSPLRRSASSGHRSPAAQRGHHHVTPAPRELG